MSDFRACDFCRAPICDQSAPVCVACAVAHGVEGEFQEPQMDFDDDDERESRGEYWLHECGKMADGVCTKAGSEDCDWECPFSY